MISCVKCYRADVCNKASHIENYNLRGGCIDSLSYDSPLHPALIPVFEDFKMQLTDLSLDQQREAIKKYREYLDILEKEINK